MGSCGQQEVLSSRKEDGDAHDAVFEVLKLADRICSCWMKERRILLHWAAEEEKEEEELLKTLGFGKKVRTL